MDASQRIVVQIPLNELWNDDGPLSAVRKRYLNSADIADLLREGVICFVVANVGDRLRWIKVEERFAFWKVEANLHIASPAQEATASDFPQGYFYFASEWSNGDGSPIILLETYH